MAVEGIGLAVRAPARVRPRYAALAGMAGNLVSIGLARFAYTPLIPALIGAGWFSAGDTVALGAANFAGYLAGALFGRAIASGFGNRTTLRFMMVLATAAFFACAEPVSLTWFFLWRFASGLAGGVIMVLVASTVLPHVAPARRGTVSGVIFLGLGLGIVAAGTLVPFLLRFGLGETWIGLGVLSAALTAFAWFGWPAGPPPVSADDVPTASTLPHNRGLRLLYVEYGMTGLGLVPTMVLLVDYVARGLGRGAELGSLAWVSFGVGATLGPVVCGRIGDRFGFGPVYRVAFLLAASGSAVLALSTNLFAIAGAAALMGALTPGTVALMLGRITERLPSDPGEQRAAWSRATSAFALVQALAGYGYALLFAASGEDYSLIFALGSAALVIGFLADLLPGGRWRGEA